ncbi:K+ channel tetramerization domain protein [Necator americanus]|uniref:K+ channel tetramerization domain protein n=1 Tax=Necator americanus TaxID=51031 RepID=W2SKH7_NECAM|nr:K+ channel tetramerization domain protein [Necator americanus]ETN70063.1 K+ channel tetramerization domain protein [Necator americanus]
MSASTVVLNVGGTKFYTTTETLGNPLARESGFFSNLDLTKGEVFIDRDPTVFMYILNYLRDGRVMFANDGLTAALLFQEAKVSAKSVDQGQLTGKPATVTLIGQSNTTRMVSRLCQSKKRFN